MDGDEHSARFIMTPSEQKVYTKENLEDWAKFSIASHTEDEIRQRILNSKGTGNMCYSYICKYSKMSESFIEELAVLSTGLIHKRNRYDFTKVKQALEMKPGTNRGEKFIEIENFDRAEEGVVDFKDLGEDRKESYHKIQSHS